MSDSYLKLKIIIFAFLLQAKLVFTQQNKFIISDKNMLNCDSILINFNSESHTTIVMEMDDTNTSLSDCLPLLHAHKSLLMFTEDSRPDPMTSWKLTSLIYNNPHTIIFTKTLSTDILLHPILQILFQSHWSLVTIVTDDTKYECEEKRVKHHAYHLVIEDFLNHLWHTYQIFYVAVHLPQACPELFITYDEKKLPNGGLYERTITTTNKSDLIRVFKRSVMKMTTGYPLKANIFYRFPTAITECDKMSIIKINKTLTNGYCGMDALIMHDVVTMFNFNVSFPEFAKHVSFGYMEHGEVTGSLGGVVRGDIDISFNARFFVLYVDGGFEFLNYISHDHLCALMKEPDAVPLWRYPFNVYNFPRWMLNVFMLMIIGILISIKLQVSSKLWGGTVLKMYTYVINSMWAGFFGFFLSNKIYRSLLTTICLLESVVFMAKYQGHINYMFATLVRYEKMSTLKDMHKNNVQLYTTPAIASLLGARNETPNNAKSALIHNLKFYPTSTSTTKYVLSNPNKATLERRTDVKLATLVNFTDNDDRPMIYVVNECIQGYYLSYIVRSGFPFTKLLQKFLTRMVEAGLPQVYYKWSRYMFSLRDYVQQPISEPRPPVKISLNEQRVAFALLMIGYIVSTIVLVIEKWWGSKRCNKIHNYENEQLPYVN